MIEQIEAAVISELSKHEILNTAFDMANFWVAVLSITLIVTAALFQSFTTIASKGKALPVAIGE